VNAVPIDVAFPGQELIDREIVKPAHHRRISARWAATKSAPQRVISTLRIESLPETELPMHPNLKVG
jgi:hypothetical protein